MLRNDMVHLKTEEGLKGMDLVVLQHEVESEVNRGVDMMEPEDHYLLDIHLPTLLLEPVEYLRGWLCSVKLARGDFEAAREEGLNDRGMATHAQPSLSVGQLNRFYNWKNIQLSD